MILKCLGIKLIHATLSDWNPEISGIAFWLDRSEHNSGPLSSGSFFISTLMKFYFGISKLFYIFAIENKQYIMENFFKILGIIAAVILAVALFPFFVAALMWILKLIAGFTFGGFLVLLLIALILYIIFG